MLPVFAEDVFNAGSAGLGILAASTGVGGLMGALVAASLGSMPHKGRLMLVGGLWMGAFYFAFTQAPGFAPALVFLALGNVGGMIFMTKQHGHSSHGAGRVPGTRDVRHDDVDGLNAPERAPRHPGRRRRRGAHSGRRFIPRASGESRSLAGSASFGDGSVQANVGVIVGIVEADLGAPDGASEIFLGQEERVLVAIASPRLDQAQVSPGPEDLMAIDLESVPGIELGDTLALEYVFAQTLERESLLVEESLDDVALFTRRWNAGDLSILGMETAEGPAPALVRVGAEIRAGSRKMTFGSRRRWSRSQRGLWARSGSSSARPFP